MKLFLYFIVASITLSAWAEGEISGGDGGGGGSFNRDGRFFISAAVMGGKMKSEATAELVFSNAGAFPTLTSGERVPIGTDNKGGGAELLFGYTFSRWWSWSGGFIAATAEDEYDYTTSKGNTHHIKVKQGAVVLVPFLWTGWPTEWIYVQAGVGIVGEGLKITSDITNVGNFDTGSWGGGLVLGAGIDYPVTDMLSLNAGLRIVSTRMREQSQTEGATAAFTSRLNEHDLTISMLRLGANVYF